MTYLEALLLGLVEGLTEYLPVSSTGHLLLVEQLFGLHGNGIFAFTIVIQFGAILAVLLHYRRMLGARVVGLWRREPQAIALFRNVAIAFVPTAVAGLLLRKLIKRFLVGPVPVVLALMSGGLLIIVVEQVLAATRPRKEPLVELDRLSAKQALLIGCGQCGALWPGMSRAMCTILTGQLVGMSTAAAAEFSFLLALPTLGAATLLELLSSWRMLVGSAEQTSLLLLATSVSLVVAWAVIAAFLRYLTRYGLLPFGVYRIVLGVVVSLLLWRKT